MRRYTLNVGARKGHSIRGQSLPTGMHLGWVHVHTHTHTHTYSPYIVTCDYSRRRIRTGGERADRISSVRSVWLVPDGKPRARLRRHPPFSLLSRCLCCRKHRASREDVTIRTNISGMFRKPLPPKWDARSKVAGLAFIRKSRNVILSRKYVRRSHFSSVSDTS